MNPNVMNVRARGYTLLELLIALAASGLLLALLSQTLGELQHAVRSARERDRSLEGIERGRRIVSRLLVEALPPSIGEDRSTFVGRPELIEFTASPPDALGSFGPLRVRLVVASAGARHLGLYMEGAAKPGAETEVTVRRTLLVDGLRWARFSYAEAPSAALQENWDLPRRLPALVQLRWRFEGDAEEREAIAVSPRRTLAGGCRFDGISLTCRGDDER